MSERNGKGASSCPSQGTHKHNILRSAPRKSRVTRQSLLYLNLWQGANAPVWWKILDGTAMGAGLKLYVEPTHTSGTFLAPLVPVMLSLPAGRMGYNYGRT